MSEKMDSAPASLEIMVVVDHGSLSVEQRDALADGLGEELTFAAQLACLRDVQCGVLSCSDRGGLQELGALESIKSNLAERKPLQRLRRVLDAVKRLPASQLDESKATPSSVLTGAVQAATARLQLAATTANSLRAAPNTLRIVVVGTGALSESACQTLAAARSSACTTLGGGNEPSVQLAVLNMLDPVRLSLACDMDVQDSSHGDAADAGRERKGTAGFAAHAISSDPSIVQQTLRHVWTAVFSEEQPQVELVLDGTVIRCDLLETVFEPDRYFAPPLAKEFQLLRGNPCRPTQSFPSALKTEEERLPQLVCAATLGSVCESSVYGQLYSLRASTRLDLDWDEQTSYHQHFLALLHSLQETGSALMLILTRRSSVHLHFIAFPCADKGTMMLKRAVSRDLLIPRATAGRGDMLANHPEESWLRRVKLSLGKIPSQETYNPLEMSVNLPSFAAQLLQAMPAQTGASSFEFEEHQAPLQPAHAVGSAAGKQGAARGRQQRK